MKIEETECAVELIPDIFFQRSEGVVLVVADGLRTSLLDNLNGRGREVDRLFEPHDVGLMLLNHAQQIAVDAPYENAKGGNTISDCGHQLRACLVRRKVEEDYVLAEAAQGLETVSGGPSRARIGYAENAAFARGGQSFYGARIKIDGISRDKLAGVAVAASVVSLWDWLFAATGHCRRSWWRCGPACTGFVEFR